MEKGENSIKEPDVGFQVREALLALDGSDIKDRAVARARCWRDIDKQLELFVLAVFAA